MEDLSIYRSTLNRKPKKVRLVINYSSPVMPWILLGLILLSGFGAM